MTKHFILFQGGADLSGDYALNEFQSLQYLRYSAAALFGWRTSDYKQWEWDLRVSTGLVR